MAGEREKGGKDMKKWHKEVNKDQTSTLTYLVGPVKNLVLYSENKTATEHF